MADIVREATASHLKKTLKHLELFDVEPRLEVGAPIVLVLAASSHRRAAFEAADFLMDWLKTRAPFWKKEAGGWVSARDSDEDAAERWR